MKNQNGWSMMFTRQSFLLSVSLALLALILSGEPAFAQGYQEDAVDKAAGGYKNAYKKVLSGSLPPNAKFDDYFTNYLFPRMSQPSRRRNIAVDRLLIGKDLSSARSQAAYDQLATLTLQHMTKFTEGNYDPVLRVNAMLLIGNLNNMKKTRSPEVAYSAAFPVMLKALNSPDQIDGVKVAALQGIRRHAKLGMGNSVNPAIVTSLGNIASAGVPPTGRSADGHSWMRREAVEILGILGDGNGVSAMLAGIIDDAKQPLSLRCSAALAFGQLSSIQVDAGKSLEKLANVAALACRQELLALQDIVAKQQTGNQRPGERRLGGQLAVDPQGKTDPKAAMSQVRLRYRLQCVRSGLAGLSKIAAAGSEKSAVSNMVGQIDDLLSVVPPIKTGRNATLVIADALMRDIQQQSRSLITKYAAIVEDTDEQTAGVR